MEVAVGAETVPVGLDGVVPVAYLGRYLIPVVAQLDFEPSSETLLVCYIGKKYEGHIPGSVATKSPV